ncbi:MAG TPA: PKD domain-containing protein [Puia sp.]|nr:PKD domain-containing protein [Puia sp.]
MILLACGIEVIAQDSIPPEIRVDTSGDTLHFSARLRPLRQLAGAPAAYYSYFWELGDGRFSFDRNPSWLYRDSGRYQVRLYATNNYDDGTAPPTRPRPVRVRKGSRSGQSWASHFFHGDGEIELKVNRNPKPGENFVVVVGYRNRYADSLGGSIALFYNERQFQRDGLALLDQRLYDHQQPTDLNGLLASLDGGDRAEADDLVSAGPRQRPFHIGWSESSASFGSGAPLADPEVPAAGLAAADMGNDNATFTSQTRSLLHNLQGQFSRHTVLHFPRVGRDEEKFAFLEMNTLPGMIRDTNATVSLIAMLIPDDQTAPPELYELDLQVVSSHDPNRLQLLNRRINYRFMPNRKELTYRINFQNTGTGPTRHIGIAVGIPPELDSRTVRIRRWSPVCPWCDTADSGQSCVDSFRRGDSLYFEFRNIYLPGLQQGIVTDKDSTEGFLEFSIRFRRKPKKIPFSTRATIIFDANQPVITNRTTARFIKGISPGIMAGYNYVPSNRNYSATGPLQLGYVLAPFSPYRPYFQAEASVVLLEQQKLEGALIQLNQDTTILGQLYVMTGRKTQTVTKLNSLDLTPLHFRYNLNDWIGVGIGATAQIFLSRQTSTINTVFFSSQLLPAKVMSGTTTESGSTRWIGSWNAQPFIDIQVGRVRTGPVLGLRFLRPLEGGLPSRFYLYAGFKL